MARPHHGPPCHWLQLAVDKAGVEWDTPAPVHTGAALIHGRSLASVLDNGPHAGGKGHLDAAK